MPRDIRDSTPPFETLCYVVTVCFGWLRQQTRRDFSGYSIGKRCDLSVVRISLWTCPARYCAP